MTDTEINIAIAEVCGWNDRWVIVKRGLYYRPDACGYTCNIQEAWVVSEKEANRHVYPHDEPVTKQRAPTLDFAHDLNAMQSAVMSVCECEGYGFQAALDYELQVVVQRRRRDLDRAQIGFWMNWADARQRAEAFLRVKGLWKETK